jgi:hypothetical protein
MPQGVPNKNPNASNDTRPNAAKPKDSANEGEGNKTAARRYNSATEAYVRSGRVPEAAENAKHAVDGPERAELERAEQAGKAELSEMERESDRVGLDGEREAPPDVGAAPKPKQG